MKREQTEEVSHVDDLPAAEKLIFAHISWRCRLPGNDAYHQRFHNIITHPNISLHCFV